MFPCTVRLNSEGENCFGLCPRKLETDEPVIDTSAGNGFGKVKGWLLFTTSLRMPTQLLTKPVGVCEKLSAGLGTVLALVADCSPNALEVQILLVNIGAPRHGLGLRLVKEVPAMGRLVSI